MVGEVSAVPAQAALPSGVRLVPVTDPAGVGLLIEVHERVFGTGHSRLHRSLLAQLRDCPEVTAMVVAMAGDEPVCSARIEFLPGRGIYRALVAYRGQLAAARGYRYLYVDASPDSQPILARLEFSRLARTTPYIWDHSAKV
jgi:hypothetical protein